MATANKKTPFNQEMAIRGANRRLFTRSPIVIEKLNESRQEFPRYKKDGSRHKKNWVKRQCEVCSQWVSSTQIAVDHIDPVVPLGGFPDHLDMWDRILIFLQRLWCDKANLQRICDDCHDKKTAKERFEKTLRTEKALIAEIINISQPGFEAEIKKKLKKFTRKKLSDPRYPSDFVETVKRLRTNYKMKV